jgi:hypothetical protein
MYDKNQCNFLSAEKYVLILWYSSVVVRWKQEILCETDKGVKKADPAISICENEMKFYWINRSTKAGEFLHWYVMQ